MLFARFLSPLMKNGTLIIINYDGKVYNVGNGGSPKLTVKFHDPKLGRNLFLNPALYAGEAYMDGTLTIEDGSLFDLLDLVMSRHISLLLFVGVIWSQSIDSLIVDEYPPEPMV